MNYPQLSVWQSQFTSNANGQALFWVLGLMVMAYLYVMLKKFPVITRVVLSVGLIVAFVAAGFLTYLLPIALVGGFLFYAHRAYPALSSRLAALPHWLLLTVGATVLRLPRLTEPMWYDETFTRGLAMLPLDRMFMVIMGDVHPPLWYMLEWVNGRVLGWSEAALRFPSLIFGVVAVLLVYRLALAFQQERRVALVAALIAMMLPGTLYYSNEARGYTLLICAVLGAAIAVLENRKLLFVGCAVIALYTHNLAWAYIGLLAVSAVYKHGRTWIQPVLVAVAAGALWLPILLAQSGDIADGFWLPPISAGWVISPLLTVTTGHRIPSELLGVISGVMIGLTIWAVFSQRQWIIKRENWLWGLIVVGAPVGLAVASALWHNVYLERALLSSTTVLCIVWARALVLEQRGNRRVAYIGLIPVLLVSLVCFYLTEFQRPAVGAKIAKACQQADTIYTTSVAAEFLSMAYTPVQPIIWPLANDLNQSLPDSAKAALGWQQAVFDELPKGTVCLIDVQTPMARGDERDYVAAIIRDNPAKSINLHQDGAYDVFIHLVEKQGES
jgi:hypothetical protein